MTVNVDRSTWTTTQFGGRSAPRFAANRDALVAKATVDLLGHGETLEVATRRVQELWYLVEALL